MEMEAKEIVFVEENVFNSLWNCGNRVVHVEKCGNLKFHSLKMSVFLFNIHRIHHLENPSSNLTELRRVHAGKWYLFGDMIISHYSLYPPYVCSSWMVHHGGPTWNQPPWYECCHLVRQPPTPVPQACHRNCHRHWTSSRWPRYRVPRPAPHRWEALGQGLASQGHQYCKDRKEFVNWCNWCVHRYQLMKQLEE